MRALMAFVVSIISLAPLFAQGNSTNSQKPVTLQIVDATGKFVGYPLDNTVALRPAPDGTFVSVVVSPHSLEPTELAVFESTDCSGKALVAYYPNYLAARTCLLG